MEKELINGLSQTEREPKKSIWAKLLWGVFPAEIVKQTYCKIFWNGKRAYRWACHMAVLVNPTRSILFASYAFDKHTARFFEMEKELVDGLSRMEKEPKKPCRNTYFLEPNELNKGFQLLPVFQQQLSTSWLFLMKNEEQTSPWTCFDLRMGDTSLLMHLSLGDASLYWYISLLILSFAWWCISLLISLWIHLSLLTLLIHTSLLILLIHLSWWCISLLIHASLYWSLSWYISLSGYISLSWYSWYISLSWHSWYRSLDTSLFWWCISLDISLDTSLYWYISLSWHSWYISLLVMHLSINTCISLLISLLIHIFLLTHVSLLILFDTSPLIHLSFGDASLLISHLMHLSIRLSIDTSLPWYICLNAHSFGLGLRKPSLPFFEVQSTHLDSVLAYSWYIYSWHLLFVWAYFCIDA